VAGGAWLLGYGIPVAVFAEWLGGKLHAVWAAAVLYILGGALFPVLFWVLFRRQSGEGVALADYMAAASWGVILALFILLAVRLSAALRPRRGSS
jgi:hypothetical protein